MTNDIIVLGADIEKFIYLRRMGKSLPSLVAALRKDEIIGHEITGIICDEFCSWKPKKEKVLKANGKRKRNPDRWK